MRYIVAGLLLTTACFVVSAAASADADHAVAVAPDQIAWMPVPPALPPGAEAAVLSGDLAKPGEFVIRVRGPAGYRLPPHWHSTDEHVTVLSGSFGVGMGDDGDPGKGMVLPAGSYGLLPAKMHHYAWAASGPFVIEIHAMGPFDIHYIHPEDQPTH